MNKPSVVSKLCKSCGFCINFCPKKVMSFSTERNIKGHFYPVIDLNGCIGCGTCTKRARFIFLVIHTEFIGHSSASRLYSSLYTEMLEGGDQSCVWRRSTSIRCAA